MRGSYRTALATLVVAVSLCVASLPAALAQSSEDLFDGEIVAVSPKAFRSGDRVSIDLYLSDDFVKAIDAARVDFNGIRVDPDPPPPPKGSRVALSVVAPDLQPGIPVTIIVRSGSLRTQAVDVETLPRESAQESAQESAPPSAVDNPYLLLAVLVATLAAVAGAIMYRRLASSARRIEDFEQQLAQAQRKSASVTVTDLALREEPDADAGTPAPIDAPVPPDDLVADIVNGDCVLVIGGGVASSTGAQPWHTAITEIARSLDDSSVSKKQIDLAIRANQIDQLAEMVLRRQSRQEVVSKLSLAFEPGSELPPIIRPLSWIPFSGYIDFSWNKAFESALVFADRQVEKVTHRRGDLAGLIRQGAPFYVKLVGDLDDPDSVLVSYNEMRQSMRDAPDFFRGVSSLATSNRFLFIGVSRESIDALMGQLQVTADTERTHYALVPNDELYSIYEESYLADYGIRLLPFQEGAYEQVAQFVDQLADRVEDATATFDASASEAQVREAYLERLELRNIGAFESLTLELHRGWNVLLGNNGCGKSTILKAIGVALCGDAVRDVAGAQALLRRNESGERPEPGAIDIRVDRARYTTHLVPDGQSVRIQSEQFTPLQTGTWAVLGFPAQRGVVQRQLSGTTKTAMTTPNVNDVLPLVAGTVDYRMDDLRQWLINTVIRSEDPSGGALASRSRKIRDKFFAIVQDLLINDEIEYHDIDRDAWRILVRTNEDLVVPIEELSQGMNSILGWVGTLVQRIYEIHPEAEQPEDRPALVLIDEIDAHLHPAWQMRLISLLEEHFPKLQVVATTHSPLLAGALDQGHVLIAERDPETRQASISRPELDTEGMAADQILTSPLFGLATTRTRGDSIDRYVELLGKEGHRSAEEETEFTKLKERVERLLSFGAKPLEQRISANVTRAIEEETNEQMERLAGLSDSEKQEVQLRLAEFFEDDSESETTR